MRFTASSGEEMWKTWYTKYTDGNGLHHWCLGFWEDRVEGMVHELWDMTTRRRADTDDEDVEGEDGDYDWSGGDHAGEHDHDCDEGEDEDEHDDAGDGDTHVKLAQYPAAELMPEPDVTMTTVSES